MILNLADGSLLHVEVLLQVLVLRLEVLELVHELCVFKFEALYLLLGCLLFFDRLILDLLHGLFKFTNLLLLIQHLDLVLLLNVK